MDYDLFDGLIDCVFVVAEDKSVVYCNEPAATICNTSVRRLTKGKPIHDFITFSDNELFLMPEGEKGKNEPFPLTEMSFRPVKDAEEDGKAQMTIHPFTEPAGDSRWIVVIRDVSIEERLHKKHHEQLKQLEDYSKNLEKKVEERTLEVKQANIMLKAIMDSLGQGFLVFNPEGTCGRIFTRACEEVLETNPESKQIWEVLSFNEEDTSTFKMWLQAAFGEQLPFDAVADLAPTSYEHSEGKNVRLEYYPIRDENKKISNIVLVATDWTAEYEAQVALEKEKKYARMVVRLVSNKSQFVKYLDSARETIKACKKHVAAALGGELDHEWLFRALHTLEGESGTFSVQSIWKASREPQELLEPIKSGYEVNLSELIPQVSDSLNNLEQKLDQFLEENTDLFKVIGIGEKRLEIAYSEVDSLLNHLRNSGVREEVVNDFQSELYREPVDGALSHYSEVVKQVSDRLGRPMNEIEWHGMEHRLYLPPYQDLFASLVHAFRNAIDHGMESMPEREDAGKPKLGTLQVYFESFDQSGQAWHRIRIKDDGRGINAEALRPKLSEKDSSKDWSSVPDTEVIQCVFDSGLSTKDEVGEFSGRGVGLNAVKHNAENIGGKAWVETELGKGTSLIVEVPDIGYSAEVSKTA